MKDCGSSGNNSLLLSLEIYGDYAAIRQSVRSYEIGKLKKDRSKDVFEVLQENEGTLTSETSFLTPEILFPFCENVENYIMMF